MTYERNGRPDRRFAGEPQANRSRSEAFEARTPQQAQLVPGRRTLTGSLDPAPVDVMRRFDAQLEIMSCQLATLEAANRAGDHHASGPAACAIRAALRIAEQVVAVARAESQDLAASLEHRLVGAREAVRPALELAFTPSPAAVREAVHGAGRAQWDREVAAWRAARGRVDLDATSAASEPGSSPQPWPAASAYVEASPEHAAATEGVAGTGTSLPHLDLIQRSFGRRDVTGVRAHVGGAAAEATRAIGATAYAAGTSVAFAAPPDLHDPSAPKLSGDHEEVLLAALRSPVREGDAVQAWERFDRFLSWLLRLSLADRRILRRRLEEPAATDELARSFHKLFRAEWRTRALEALRSSAPAAAVPRAAAAPADPWVHMFGEASTHVNKLGRVQAPAGRTLRERPSPDSAPSTPAPLPFDTLVVVLRRTTQPTAAKRWCYVAAPERRVFGFCEERFLAIDPPEPHATLHRVQRGDTLGKIASDAYGWRITGGNDERLYVQGLYEANKDRAGVRLAPVELSRRDTIFRWEDEERTLEVYRGAQVLEGMSLWIPSNDFIQRLKASGAITTGATAFTNAWRAAAELVDDAIEGVKYVAGFLVGLLEGAWSAIVDLFKGAAEMVGAIAEALYHLVTGNPGRIKDMLMKWVDKMKSAWDHRGEIADEFMKKWNAPSGWDRGRFQGEVLGWVMMTVLTIIVTAGESAVASAGGLAARFPQIVKLLKTVDAAGDVTTYLGGAIKGVKAAGKLPAAASEVVKGKLGRSEVARDAHTATRTPGDASHAPQRANETVTVAGYAQGPRLKWAKNSDGAVRTVDEAVEIARKHGVEIPDDILLRKVSGKYLPDNTYAKYFGADTNDPGKMVRWEDFYNKDLDQLLVRVEQSVFQSDEAIVAILGHEMHELNNLRRLFEESGGSMTYRRLHYLISPGIKGNLHDQAWDVADKLVMGMRKERGAST